MQEVFSRDMPIGNDWVSRPNEPETSANRRAGVNSLDSGNCPILSSSAGRLAYTLLLELVYEAD